MANYSLHSCTAEGNALAPRIKAVQSLLRAHSEAFPARAGGAAVDPAATAEAGWLCTMLAPFGDGAALLEVARGGGGGAATTTQTKQQPRVCDATSPR